MSIGKVVSFPEPRCGGSGVEQLLDNVIVNTVNVNHD